MAEFLSAAWLAELDAAARAAESRLLGDAPDDVGPLVVQQEVTGTPFGDVVYHLVLDRDGARVHAGPVTGPDLTFVTDYETATATHRGETGTATAVARGATHVRGDLAALTRCAGAVALLGDLFAAVRADTTYAR